MKLSTSYMKRIGKILSQSNQLTPTQARDNAKKLREDLDKSSKEVRAA